MTKTSGLVSVLLVRTVTHNFTLNIEDFSFVWIYQQKKYCSNISYQNIIEKNEEMCYEFYSFVPSNICKEHLSKQIIFLPAMRLLFTCMLMVHQMLDSKE